MLLAYDVGAILRLVAGGLVVAAASAADGFLASKGGEKGWEEAPLVRECEGDIVATELVGLSSRAWLSADRRLVFLPRREPLDEDRVYSHV
jgi:hypothetical protein